MQKFKMFIKNSRITILKHAISARERAVCQLCVLSFRVEVKEEKDTKS